MIYSTEGLTRLFQDRDALFGYSSRRPLTGLWADDGSTILTASSFTWNNQGGATSADENGTVLLTAPTDTGRALRILERSAPSTPYTYIGAFTPQVSGDGSAAPGFGMAFRESSSSKLMLFEYSFNDFFNGQPLIQVARWSDSNTRFTTNFGGHYIMLKSEVVWVKIENNGTNLKWYVSADGFEWIQYFSESKTAYFSGNPDKVAFFACNESNGSGTAFNLRCHHWSKGE
jgi:hypothetical protein